MSNAMSRATALGVACLLAAYGVGAVNPLSFAGRAPERYDPDAPGIAGVARHPLLWALLLWSGSHLVPNGDLAHVLLFGGLAAMAAAGMVAIDRRLRQRLAAADFHDGRDDRDRGRRREDATD